MTLESMSRISVIGNVNVDFVVWPAAELPPPGAEVHVETISMRAAGSAGNSALALARLGQVPSLAGCVGGDRFGQFILEELAAAGIEEGVTVLPEEPTGITIAFQAPGRDRSFCYAGTLRYPPCGARLRASFCTASVLREVASSLILIGILAGGARRAARRSQTYCRSLTCSYLARTRQEVSPDSKIPKRQRGSCSGSRGEGSSSSWVRKDVWPSGPGKSKGFVLRPCG